MAEFWDGGEALPGVMRVGGVEDADAVDRVVVGVGLRCGLEEAEVLMSGALLPAVLVKLWAGHEASPLTGDVLEEVVGAWGDTEEAFEGYVVR